jgi:hypothetical protein
MALPLAVPEAPMLTCRVLHATAMPTVVKEQRVTRLGISHQPTAGPQDDIPKRHKVPPLGVIVISQHYDVTGAEAKPVGQQVLRSVGTAVGGHRRQYRCHAVQETGDKVPISALVSKPRAMRMPIGPVTLRISAQPTGVAW